MLLVVENEVVVLVEQDASLGVSKVHLDFERGRVAFFHFNVLHGHDKLWASERPRVLCSNDHMDENLIED